MSGVTRGETPGDRRSWARARAHVGDCVAPTDIQRAHARNIMWATGILPADQLEVVSLAQIDRAPGRFDGLDDVQEAIRDGRLVTYAVDRSSVSPVTQGLVDQVIADE